MISKSLLNTKPEKGISIKEFIERYNYIEDNSFAENENQIVFRTQDKFTLYRLIYLVIEGKKFFFRMSIGIGKFYTNKNDISFGCIDQFFIFCIQTLEKLYPSFSSSNFGPTSYYEERTK